MPAFSLASLDRLATCDQRLSDLFFAVIMRFDCAVICGHRNKEDQDKVFSEFRSEKPWPHSRHNATPSLAVDVVPFVNGKASWVPSDCTLFAGKVLGIARSMGFYEIISGADWNDNGGTTDQRLFDLVHFEIRSKS